MISNGHLRRLSVLSLVLLALAAGAAERAHGDAEGCPAYPVERHFLPWLDVMNYTLAPNGGLEEGAAGWALSGGAAVVAGNESFFVRDRADQSSLYLPSGSSASTGATCVELLEGTMRFFVKNTGSLLSTLQVEVLYRDALGKQRAHTVGLLIAGQRWQPTLPVVFLANLTHPPLVTDGTVDVAFRFTPRGLGGRWSVDDVFVDPFKGT